ncbi:hypothetical protein D5R55_30110 [Burkholderia cenocepacia]|uniref:Uncharacterized protein n=1 Tax=Burkholderia cenocepacia TaxID=95486 RepID=A0A3Q9FCT8_9BURK|nr:hypothetical protein D5R55_30110 [Burkholderia cenocepacia]
MIASTRSVRCIAQGSTPLHVDICTALPVRCRVDLFNAHSSTRHFTSSRKISPSAEGSRISSPLNPGDTFAGPLNAHAHHSPRSDSPG